MAALPRSGRALLWLGLGLLLLCGRGAAQTLIATVPVGMGPHVVVCNASTNKWYVGNQDSSNLTVVDGATFATTTIDLGYAPFDAAVNATTNRIYVSDGNELSVINGATNQVTTVSIPGVPAGVAVNATTNRIYISNASRGTVAVVDGATLTVKANVAVGNDPIAIAVNAATNKAYVANLGSNSVTEIDGATLATRSLTVGSSPAALAVNPVTNKIYVVNYGSGSVSVIDGSQFTATTVAVGSYPLAIDLNTSTNKIYVTNSGDDSVTVIDGALNQTTTLALDSGSGSPEAISVNAATNQIYIPESGANTLIALNGNSNSLSKLELGQEFPLGVAVNSLTNMVLVTNNYSGTVSAVSGTAGAGGVAQRFALTTPCRLVDTRQSGGPIAGGSSRNFILILTGAGGCNLPASATAFSLNVTVVPQGPLGYLTIWPTGQPQPLVSTMNSLDGRIKANAAIVPAGYQGAVSVYVSNTANVVLDVNGYFEPASGSSLEFYPLPPCRVFDTRNASGPLGGPSLKAGTERDFPILSATACNIPSDAQAYAMNVTAVPHGGLGYLTVWPAGGARPTVSTLNDPTGTVVANAAIVAAGASGAIAAYASNDTHLVGDITGYFTSPGTGGLSFYPITPCRTLDTRQSGNHQPFNGELGQAVEVANGVCGIPGSAAGFVFNATVVPNGALGYLTLWPDGENQPLVSTLNALDGAITSNMAIVPSLNGTTDAYASGSTQLVLDISGYFAP